MSGRARAVYARRGDTVVYVLPWTDAGGARVAYEQDADYTTERITLTERALQELESTTIREVPVSCTPAWCDPEAPA